jgi:glycosyltransferase involved in cell wall biosynthesis
MDKPKISVVIPALDEEQAIGLVVRDIPRQIVDEVIVVDNGSRDATAGAAQAAGARVVHEPCRGYGAACLKGIASASRPEIIVFLDADYSDYPEDMGKLVAPIIAGAADLVIGSRIAGGNGSQVLPPQAYWGTRLAVGLVRVVYGFRFTDLGPFRAIRFDALRSLDMGDRDFGWTIEMQIKAVKHNLRIKEIPVGYRPRIGASKISGTLWGSVRAGIKIFYTLARHMA